MKKINLYEAGEFGDKGLKKLLVHELPTLKSSILISKPARNCRCTSTTLKVS